MFKKFISVVGAILLVVTITLTIFTNASPMALLNNYQLNYNLTHPTKDTIFINNVIPFKWDHGYYFSPYVELKDIKKHINVKHFPDKLYNDGIRLILSDLENTFTIMLFLELAIEDSSATVSSTAPISG